MSNIIPLQIHPWPVSDEQMALIREAKATLNLELKVLPTQAVPGLHARVLALGKVPPWVCDAALVKDSTIKESLTVALEWLLIAPPDDNRGFMVKDYLEVAFGEGVTELPAPACKCQDLGCAYDRAIRNYEPLEGRCSGCYDAGCHLAKGLCLRE